MTVVFGPIGALGGGWLSDRLVRRGRVDGPLLVGVTGALGMALFAGAYPLVGSAAVAAALLVPVNLFAALPWGPANAAMAAVMPERMRGQGAALMLLVVNLVSGALGPTAVALATDRLFGGPAGLRWALALITVVGMLLAAALLLAGRAPFRRTVAQRDPSA
jgi:MFS family permease